MCPSYDEYDFPLGPGTQVIGSMVLCSYASFRQLNNTDIYCNYNLVSIFSS